MRVFYVDISYIIRMFYLFFFWFYANQSSEQDMSDIPGCRERTNFIYNSCIFLY
jgi:hypothetical protein